MATKNYPHLLDRIATADMPPKCKAVLMAMISFTRRGEDICEFSKPEIANRACMTRPTADSAAAELVERGLIRKEGEGRQTIWVIEEDNVLALPRKPTLKQVKVLPERNLPESDFTEPGKNLSGDPVKSLPDTGKKFTCRTAQTVESSEESAPLVSSAVSKPVSSTVSTPLISPPLGFWAAKAKAAREERESRVLNGKGLAESVSTPTPIEAPRPERKPTPKPRIQDQPEQLTLTSPVATPMAANSPRKAPKFVETMLTDRQPRDAAEKAEIEAIARVYEYWVMKMGSPKLLEPSGVRRKREEKIREYLRHPEFDESDLIAAIDGCFGDDWRMSEGHTSLIKYILRDEDSIHMFKAKAKKALTRSVRPTEYRNKRPNREQMLHHARLVASGTSSKHTLEGMCRYYNIGEEEAQTMIDEAQAKYSHLPNYGLPTHAGWGQ